MALPINVEDCLSFLVRIPCHKGEEGISRALLNGNENDRVNTENDGINDGINEPVNDTINSGNDTINDTISTVSDTIKGLTAVQRRIVETIITKPEITRQEMMNLLNVSGSTISRALKHLQE